MRWNWRGTWGQRRPGSSALPVAGDASGSWDPPSGVVTMLTHVVEGLHVRRVSVISTVAQKEKSTCRGVAWRGGRAAEGLRVFAQAGRPSGSADCPISRWKTRAKSPRHSPTMRTASTLQMPFTLRPPSPTKACSVSMALSDHPDALHWLARCYLDGNGVVENKHRGLMYLAKSAELGHSISRAQVDSWTRLRGQSMSSAKTSSGAS